MAKNDKPRKDGNPNEEGSSGTSTAPPVTVRDRDDFVTHLLGKHGEALTALKVIAGDILKLRRRAQVAETELAKVKDLVPDKDSVTLKGEEAKAYGKIKEKGLTLDKVPAELDKIPTLEKEAKSGKREKELSDAAGTKYKKDVLATLLGDAVLRQKDVPKMKADKSGIEMVKGTVIVTKDGDKEVETDLDAYLEKNHKDFMPVLLAKGQEKTADITNRTNSGARMPRQTTSTAVESDKPADITSVVDKVTSSAFVRPSQRRKAAEAK